VEVALLPDGGVAVRDSADRARTQLMCSNQQWRHFVSRMKTHQFDP
jgi:hypothetical protein